MTDPSIRATGATQRPVYGRPAQAPPDRTPSQAGVAGDGLQLSNPVALMAARLRAQLPPGVEAAVNGTKIELTRAGSGEPLYAATFADGAWSHGGYRQHGLFGPPERPGILAAFEAVGIIAPKPAAPAPPPEPVAPARPQVPDPGPAGYERIARMLAAELPGIEVKASATGIAFSRNGEGFYGLSVREGQWSSGGYRQHGIRGHADSPAVRQVLERFGYGN